MKIELKATLKDKELLVNTEVKKEQIPFLIQDLHRKLDEFYNSLNN